MKLILVISFLFVISGAIFCEERINQIDNSSSLVSQNYVSDTTGNLNAIYGVFYLGIPSPLKNNPIFEDEEKKNKLMGSLLSIASWGLKAQNPKDQEFARNFIAAINFTLTSGARVNGEYQVLNVNDFTNLKKKPQIFSTFYDDIIKYVGTNSREIGRDSINKWQESDSSISDNAIKELNKRINKEGSYLNAFFKSYDLIAQPSNTVPTAPKSDYILNPSTPNNKTSSPLTPVNAPN
jgi:hypothetical protein